MVALSAEATASAAAISSSVEISPSVRRPWRALASLSAARSAAVRAGRPGYAASAAATTARCPAAALTPGLRLTSSAAASVALPVAAVVARVERDRAGRPSGVGHDRRDPQARRAGGRGQRQRAAHPQTVFVGVVAGDRDPAALRASAAWRARSRPSSSWLDSSIVGSLGRAGAHPHAALAHVEQPALVDAHRGDPGARAIAAAGAPAAKLFVLNTSRPEVTQMSAVAKYWVVARSMPSQQIVAGAADRDAAVDREPHDSSERDRPRGGGAQLRERDDQRARADAVRWPAAASARRAANAAGIRQSVASASATPPTIVSAGREQRERERRDDQRDAGDARASRSCAAARSRCAPPARRRTASAGRLGAQVQQRRERGERGGEHAARRCASSDRARVDGLLARRSGTPLSGSPGRAGRRRATARLPGRRRRARRPRPAPAPGSRAAAGSGAGS